MGRRADSLWVGRVDAKEDKRKFGEFSFVGAKIDYWMRMKVLYLLSSAACEDGASALSRFFILTIEESMIQISMKGKYHQSATSAGMLKNNGSSHYSSYE